jgi:hypothetical protein
MASRDRRPLLAYLRVQEQFEAQLLTTLERAAAATQKEIRSLAGKQGIGARVRQDQLRLVLKAIRAREAELWRIVGSQVKAARKDAIAAAVKSNFVYEDMLLRGVLTKAERDVLLSSATRQAERGIDSVIARLTGLSDYGLSSQVYKTSKLANGFVENRIIEVLARGGSWKELADEVRGLIKPNVPGGVSYAAKRLGRTELNNAFHAATVTEAKRSPFIDALQWTLSGSHPKPDECNSLADEKPFKPEDIPGKPHPQCLCYMVPVTPSREDFINNFLGGKYDSYLG